MTRSDQHSVQGCVDILAESYVNINITLANTLMLQSYSVMIGFTSFRAKRMRGAEEDTVRSNYP